MHLDPLPAAMNDLIEDADISLLLSSGQVVTGRLRVPEDHSGWWRCDTTAGAVFIRPEQVVAVSAEATALNALTTCTGTKTSAETGGAVTGQGKSVTKRRSVGRGRPWDDDDLRLVANAFLDDVDIGLIASEFNRSRAQIKQLRFGFEAARGNLDPDQIDDLSRSWVNRWQQLLSAS